MRGRAELATSRRPGIRLPQTLQRCAGQTRPLGMMAVGPSAETRVGARLSALLRMTPMSLLLVTVQTEPQSSAARASGG